MLKISWTFIFIGICTRHKISLKMLIIFVSVQCHKQCFELAVLARTCEECFGPLERNQYLNSDNFPAPRSLSLFFVFT